MVPILSDMNAVHILLSTSTSFKWYLPFKISDQKTVCISCLSHVCYRLQASHPPWFNNPNVTWLVAIICNLLLLPQLWSKNSPQHLSHTLSVYVLNVRDDFLYQYKATSNTVVICILVLTFLDITCEDRKILS
jgi:hypothetical protein